MSPLSILQPILTFLYSVAGTLASAKAITCATGAAWNGCGPRARRKESPRFPRLTRPGTQDNLGSGIACVPIDAGSSFAVGNGQAKEAMTMKRIMLVGLSYLALGTGVSGAVNSLPDVVEIPYQRFVLTNGLTVIVHEDHKAPIVAVNIWYHVGSKNERPGRTGFAHLFEHLMFNGSENFNDDFFQAMERIGATDMNGTTSEDRTNYFEDVPKSALDVALWMESDRMGHFTGAISQGRLDEQRGVVQNEKRQGENQPYGRARELIPRATYPSHHPYSWTVIGSMEDLNAASLDDVKEWFRTYYGTANAVIAIAGDIDVATARAKVEKYFGDIPSGPPVSRFEAWPAKRSGAQRQVMEDRVPQSRIYKVWNVPEYRAADSDYLDLAADILSSGKNSRLYERLVYRDQIASSVSAFNASREIGGQFQIVATARPGEDLAKVEKALDEELDPVRRMGRRSRNCSVKIEELAGFIRGVERIGGFGGKSDVLAMNEVFAGSPDFYKTKMQRVREATAVDVHERDPVALRRSLSSRFIRSPPTRRPRAPSIVPSRPSSASFLTPNFPPCSARRLPTVFRSCWPSAIPSPSFCSTWS
ncbi:MAG: pitrilysin family protein [Verrucomicrobiota bacterium]